MWGTSSAGAYGADFAGDRSLYYYSSAGNSGYRSQGEIINRHKAIMSRNVITYKRTTNFIPSNVVYDVSMKVLPNAPIDPATGLEKPTIAIGGNKGLSILQRTGPNPTDDIFYAVIPDQSDSYRYCQTIAFRDDNRITYIMDSSKRLGKTVDAYNLTANRTIGHWSSSSGDGVTLEASYFNAYAGKNGYYFPSYGNITTLNVHAQSGNYDIDQIIPMNDSQIACRDETKGITLVYESKRIKSDTTEDYDASLGAYITLSYNTGWFPCKSVFIMANNSDDGATTSLSGTDLIVNGTFNSNISGWSDGSGAGSDIQWNSGNGLVGGSMYLNGSSGYAYGSRSFTAVVGKQYAFNVWWQNFSGSREGNVYIGTSTYGSQLVNANTSAVGSGGIMVHGTFKATQTTHYLTCYTGWPLYVDQVRVTECVPDRSSQQASLMTNGTVARNPTVTGSKVVAYGPFTESNFLYMRGNKSFRFEENDWCLGFWFYPTNNNAHQSLVGMTDREFGISLLDGQSYGQKIRIYTRNSSGTLRPPDGNYQYAVNEWQHIIVNFTGGNTKTVYINGQHDITITGNNGEYDIDQVDTDHNGAGLGLYVGTRYTTSGAAHAATHTKIALLKIAKSNVSADSARKWYEDEKIMINNPGECTLYGTNAVNDLAYDSSTDTLHAATASGRSDFRGLVRINNTTTNSTKISAAGGVISEIV